MNIEQYIIESCEHQMALRQEDFIGMARAYEYALATICLRPGWQIRMNDLAPLITRVNAEQVWVPWRSQPATFANGRWATNAQHVQREMEILIKNQHLLPPDNFYWEFEEIHPWHDGNGRVGSLLWNVRNNSITDPVHPPQNPKWFR